MRGNAIQPGSPSKRDRLASLYFATQASLGLLWWIGIGSSPAFAKCFFSLTTVSTDITTFALADSIWFVVLSGIASVAIWRKMKITYPVVWCLVGAVGYAFFCCIGMLLNGGSWLSVVAMYGSWLGTLYCASTISRANEGIALPETGLEPS